MTTPDFWPDCGYSLLQRDDDGRLLLTPDFLRAAWLRPEVAPVDESLDADAGCMRHCWPTRCGR